MFEFVQLVNDFVHLHLFNKVRYTNKYFNLFLIISIYY